MGGAALLKDPDKVSETRTMLLSVVDLVIDPATGVFFHGIEVDKRHKQRGITVLSNNKVKWGRANAWILLTFARFILQNQDDTEMIALTSLLLSNFANFQRDNGSFGNVVDIRESADETSLTAIFVYAVGVLETVNPTGNFVTNATLAFTWLDTRQVEGLKVSDTCGAAPLETEIELYEERVGLEDGPAVGFFLWAKIGGRLLQLI